ncbi:hypothetical protein [Mycetocola spongiae]|uniref:hypothetical protein n=1 Tax=Mycetocola spongiae TaxID=2859226 RepID=UPI001CF15A4F|nr:hypothetical protein [Mycetocola spongiae]UCR87903.1 hypothetical protein KXZ72_07685 [Mycetocola spongiae]
MGTIINSLEGINQRSLYETGGLLSGRFTENHPRFAKLFPQVASIIDSAFFAIALDGVLLVNSLSTIARSNHKQATPLRPLISTAVAILQRLRTGYGRDGSDQMFELLSGICTLAATSPLREQSADNALRAINIELSISYVASGLVKLFGPEWRNGTAVASIMQTSSYGSPWLSQALNKHPSLSTAACWATIAGETLFPVIFMLPTAAARRLLPIATLFHLAIAYFMGLPRFFWAFGAAHVASLFVIENKSKR